MRKESFVYFLQYLKIMLAESEGPDKTDLGLGLHCPHIYPKTQ